MAGAELPNGVRCARLSSRACCIGRCCRQTCAANAPRRAARLRAGARSCANTAAQLRVADDQTVREPVAAVDQRVDQAGAIPRSLNAGGTAACCSGVTIICRCGWRRRSRVGSKITGREIGFRADCAHDGQADAATARTSASSLNAHKSSITAAATADDHQPRIPARRLAALSAAEQFAGALAPCTRSPDTTTCARGGVAQVRAAPSARAAALVDVISRCVAGMRAARVSVGRPISPRRQSGRAAETPRTADRRRQPCLFDGELQTAARLVRSMAAGPGSTLIAIASRQSRPAPLAGCGKEHAGDLRRIVFQVK